MLPFNLKLSERRRGRGGKTSQPQDGSSKMKEEHPIVRAVKNDLEDMLIRFRRRLVAERECCLNARGQDRTTTTGKVKTTKQPREPQSRSFKSGDAVLNHDNVDHQVGIYFGIFKNEFSSSKGGMFHNLCPSRCNREAYSQMLYSLCLTILKEILSPNSSNNNNNNKNTEISSSSSSGSDDSDDSDTGHITVTNEQLEKSGFAVFALFALWETNPLPRGIDSDNPLRNLTMGLLDPENPRALYRRYFHQDIRIDRSHFVLMLRLREIALSIQSKCEGEYYDAKYQQLKQRQEQRKSKRSHKKDDKCCIEWRCSCGLATDILEVTERLFPKLKLCEYVGPIGLESLAWNPDYNYKFCQTSPETCDGATSNASNTQRQIVTTIDDYKKCIDTIRSTRHSRSNDERTNENTTAESRERNNEIMKDLFASMSDDDTTGSGKEKYDDSRSSNHDHAQNGAEIDSHQQSNVLEEERRNESVQNEPSPKPKYDFLVPKELNSDLQQRLTMCLKKLAERERPAPPFQLPAQLEDESRKETMLDDVSSIGYGGVASVATCQGRNALQNLLSQVQKDDDNNGNTGIVVGATKQQSYRHSKQQTPIENMTTNFLASTNNDDTDRHDPPEADEESVDSEVTFDSSQMDDDDSDAVADDLVSVATSAVGRRALKDLLGTVTATSSESKTRKKSMPRKRKSQPSQSPSGKRKKDEGARKGPAVNSGQNALSQLLQKALDPSNDSDKNSKKEEDGRNRESGGGYHDDEGQEDFVSITESVSVGPGRRALDDLLSSLKK